MKLFGVFVAPLTNSDYEYLNIIFIVKLHFVCVCLKVQKWTQNNTKVAFHPTQP